MELIFLGGDFEIRSAPIDDYYSLQWNENYYEESEFELHLAPDLFATASASEYVYNNEADEAMIITDIQASDETKRTLRLSGKGLETLLHMRVMDEADTYSGTVEDIARQAVTKYALTGDRALTLLRLGTYHGYTETAAATNKRGVFLDEWLRELLKPYEMTFRIHYDFEANALDFEVWRGLDRTQEQTDNTWAIFSTSFENLARIKYARNRSDYRNVAIVSNSDGTKRVEVDKTDGAARREIYVDADDELDTASMTQLGEQALAEYAMIETVGGDVLGSANMVYGTNYALGDRCNIEDASLGISAAVRLTQMTTVVERGVTRRIPSFGEQYLTLPQYIAREVRASSGGGSSGGGVVDLTEVWDAIDANADEIEVTQAAVSDNAADIAAIDTRVAALEDSGGGGGSGGSGLPDGYIPLEFIKANNGAYINTEFTPNQNTRVICRAIVIASTVSNWLYGSERGPTSSTYAFVASSGGHYLTRYGNTQYSYSANANKLDWFTVDKNKNITTLDGADEITATKVNFTAPGALYLFADNNNGTAAATSTSSMKYCKIYDNSVLVRDYIPCINPSGEYGMYDKVNTKFYGNAGTGSFTGG